MELKFLEIIILLLCLLSIVPIIIFFKRKKQPITDVDKLIQLYNEEINNNLEKLNKGNKIIDEIEQKILICKKKLKINIFDK